MRHHRIARIGRLRNNITAQSCEAAREVSGHQRAQRPRFFTRRYREATLHTWRDSSGWPDFTTQPLLLETRLRSMLICSERHNEPRYGHTMCMHAVRNVSWHVTQCPKHEFLRRLKSRLPEHHPNNFGGIKPHATCILTYLRLCNYLLRSFAFLQQLRLYRGKTTYELIYTRRTTTRIVNSRHKQSLNFISVIISRYNRLKSHRIDSDRSPS